MSTAPFPRPRDEVLDETGRLRGPWRRVLGTLLGIGTAALRERSLELERGFADEGAGSDQGPWRCDPVPFLFQDAEFATLSAGLAQRASLLNAVLADLYGPRHLLRDGTLPPALVYGAPAYLRAARGAAPGQMLHLYAADLLRGPDGAWQVIADRTECPAGIGYALANRRLMARVLPEMFASMEVAPLRPFFDAWQGALQGLAAQAGGQGLALLTPGQCHGHWYEHVLLARELGCALVEAGDLTVRDGALWVKTLRGLLPVHAMLRRQASVDMDPLELHALSHAGVPGLMSVARQGGLAMANAPGAGLAEHPGLAAFLPLLCRRLLGTDLALPSAPCVWLGDGAGPRGALLRRAADHRVAEGDAAALPRPLPPSPGAAGFGALRDRAAAVSPEAPSVIPCVVGSVAGDGQLRPRPVCVRLFLLWDGAGWRALQGGVAHVVEDAAQAMAGLQGHALTKDVWVLMEDGGDFTGGGSRPGHLPAARLPVRRMAGDMPSRVADNFFWFGRYLERLETAARLIRAMLQRLGRAGLLPRDVPELNTLAACLVEADILSADLASGAGPASLAEALLRALTRDDGTIAGLTGQVQALAETLRDRLSGEMYTMVAQGVRTLKGARLALRSPRPGGHAAHGGGAAGSIGVLTDFAQRVLEFSAAVSGYAAENMVRGGGRLFLDLGRRIERAQAVAGQLALALDQRPERLEAGLILALELCDSALTYRSRYLNIVQAAPVLDLVLADDGNPRGLSFQLHAARFMLRLMDEHGPLAAGLDAPIAEVEAMVRDIENAADPAAAAAILPERLRGVAQQVAGVSDAVRRHYFTLLPAVFTEAGL